MNKTHGALHHNDLSLPAWYPNTNPESLSQYVTKVTHRILSIKLGWYEQPVENAALLLALFPQRFIELKLFLLLWNLFPWPSIKCARRLKMCFWTLDRVLFMDAGFFLYRAVFIYIYIIIALLLSVYAFLSRVKQVEKLQHIKTNSVLMYANTRIHGFTFLHQHKMEMSSTSC